MISIKNNFILLISIFIFNGYSLLADCKLCPEIIAVKITLRNGVIRNGHISVHPEEELSEKTERTAEVIRRAEKLRLYLSLDMLKDLNYLSIQPNTVYIDIAYKDIAKIERL